VSTPLDYGPVVRVLGVDAYKRGWVGVVLDQALTVIVAPRIDPLVAAAGLVDVVAIDIPIGMPVEGWRAADTLAKQRIGALRSSVFMTPLREAITLATYDDANAMLRARGMGGLSRQAYGLRTKLLEVDAWVRDTALDVREVHPEVSFAAMAGRPLNTRKLSWNGVQERRALLRDQGLGLPDDLGLAGSAANIDDVLDAAAAAWSGRRIVTGQAHSLPNPPERTCRKACGHLGVGRQPLCRARGSASSNNDQVSMLRLARVCAAGTG
jgi:predicted RNase H-like nuclease